MEGIPVRLDRKIRFRLREELEAAVRRVAIECKCPQRVVRGVLWPSGEWQGEAGFEPLDTMEREAIAELLKEGHPAAIIRANFGEGAV